MLPRHYLILSVGSCLKHFAEHDLVLRVRGGKSSGCAQVGNGIGGGPRLWRAAEGNHTDVDRGNGAPWTFDTGARSGCGAF